MSVSEWADKNRVLIARTSAEPGPWRTRRAPYLRSVMDAFGDPEIEEICFCKATQVGGTEAIYNMMGFAIAQEPAPMMIVMPTVEIAEYVSRNRFQPMVESIEALNGRKSAKSNEFSMMEMNFLGMVLSLSGANSAASLATRPVRYLFLDEVDKYPAYTGREGEPIGLAVERTKTFWNRKIVKISTPTVSTGNIWNAFNACVERYEFFVPCPFCGTYQTLRFWGEKRGDYRIRWHAVGDDYDPALVVDDTWYECVSCKGEIRDRHKSEMLERGEWRDQDGLPFHTHKQHARQVGFHLNTLYSPWVSFGETAARFLKSKDVPEDFMNFLNLWLALPATDFIVDKVPESLEHLVAMYDPGVIPKDAITLLMSVDVQQYYLQYVIRAWSADMESWLIREGQVESFEELGEIMENSAYPVEGSPNKMGVRLALIDAGFRTEEVYDFVRFHKRIARATKGASHPMRSPYSASRIETYPNGKKMPEGIALWLFDTGYWKDVLARRMGMATEEERAFVRWHVYPEVTAAYVSQVTSEHKITVRNRKTGKITHSWEVKPNRRRNEAFDLEVLNMLAADMLGLRYFVTARQRERALAEPKQEVPVIAARAIQQSKPKFRPPVAQSKWMTRRSR